MDTGDSFSRKDAWHSVNTGWYSQKDTWRTGACCVLTLLNLFHLVAAILVFVLLSSISPTQPRILACTAPSSCPSKWGHVPQLNTSESWSDPALEADCNFVIRRDSAQPKSCTEPTGCGVPSVHCPVSHQPSDLLPQSVMTSSYIAGSVALISFLVTLKLSSQWTTNFGSESWGYGIQMAMIWTPIYILLLLSQVIPAAIAVGKYQADISSVTSIEFLKYANTSVGCVTPNTGPVDVFTSCWALQDKIPPEIVARTSLLRIFLIILCVMPAAPFLMMMVIGFKAI